MDMSISKYNVEKSGLVTKKDSGKPVASSLVRGYLSVHVVCDDGIRRMRRVHRLVAERFIENPDNLPEVNHKDENKLNNSYENLEWCTRQYNAEYSLSKQYEMQSPSGLVVSFFNMAKFCRENGLNKSNLLKVYQGERQSHKGWRMPPNKGGDLSLL